ncbi:ribosomal RNA small subunit methyltransferase B [Clostridia bacterium]|nr:ribosomal RNA small subunit methyltransferase B [Clostridia bacterium]
MSDNRPIVRKPPAKFIQNRPGPANPVDNRPRSAIPMQNRPAFNKPSARAVALNTLQDVTRSDAYASLALDKRLRAVGLTAQDSALTTQLVYGVLEKRLALDYRLNLLLKEPERIPPLARDLLRLGAYQILYLDRIPDHAACDETVKLAKLYPSGESYVALINATLRRLSEKKDGMVPWPDDPLDALSIRLSWPRWVLERLIPSYGEEKTREICLQHPVEAGINIRINPLKISAEAFEKRMALRKWQWRSGLLPGSYVVLGVGSIGEDPDFRSGLFSVEGVASMLAADAVGAKPGIRILDACAAPGGKSAFMAERMNQSGRVFAVDKYPHRVELIRAQVQRLGLENVKPIERDMTLPNPEWQQQFDAVLIDAPCSGLGVAADKPDIRYRLTPEGVDELVEIQRSLIEVCSSYVKPGGVMVYATCSILPEENAGQVEPFLKEHKEFRVDRTPIHGFTPDEFGLQLLPHRTSGENPQWIEGFFVSRMIRSRSGLYA